MEASEKTARQTLVMCVQLAKLATDCSDLGDLGSVPAGAFGRCPAQIALNYKGIQSMPFGQDLAPSGGGGSEYI